jgi:RNA polymerase sigma-70 factor (ECF subfamily)
LRSNADVLAGLEDEDSATEDSAPQTAQDASGDSTDERCATLAAQAKDGDERAIERLWELNESDVHVQLSRYLRDPRDVAEASQEVFIRMLTALPDYKVSETPFRFWLLRIARNHAIDVLRREKHTRVEDEVRINRLMEASGDGSGTPEWGWLNDEQTALAVSSLPVEQQRMLLLRFGFGLRSEEVAGVLRCSPDAVRKQQSRALRRLAETLRESGETA